MTKCNFCKQEMPCSCKERTELEKVIPIVVEESEKPEAKDTEKVDKKKK